MVEINRQKIEDENKILKDKLAHLMAQHDLREERVAFLAKLVDAA